MNEYVIEVPYTHCDGMTRCEATVEYQIFAKSEEQARYRAKKYAKKVGPVTSVGSTELKDVSEV